MRLEDYISRSPFAKAKKDSSYDAHFVVATISKIRDCFKHLIQNNLQTVKKLNGILKLHSSPQSPNKLIAPQIPSLVNNNSQLWITAGASQSPYQINSSTLALQLAYKNKAINPHLKLPFASRIPRQNSSPQFEVKNLPIDKSQSNKKFSANTL